MVLVPLLTSALLATIVLSAPSSTAGVRRSQPLQRVRNANFAAGDLPKVIHSKNWSGSAWAKPNGTFISVAGTFVTPKLGAPDGYSSAWVGIDGFTCQDAILQTGVQFNFINNTPAYYAWYEWYPADVYYFDGITIDEGDEIWTQVVATSPTTGKAVIKNLSKGQSVEKELSSAYPLCGANAEWIVEDFSYDNGTLVPLNDFGSVTFYDAFALTNDPNEEILSPYNASIILLEQNNKTITCVDEKELEVTISYDVPPTQ
ncbi:peptidase A4 family-domain-containing protein [Amanita rubescens]|nr:peptidase A4 family-domain-containing protein [Amanita rubescens]